MRRTLAALILLLWLVPAVAQALSEREKIELLLGHVAGADLVFIRNGSEHAPEAAAKHLRSKWKSAGEQIRTAREFVEQIASRSATTGKAYRVRFPDGSERDSRDWLLEALEQIEAGQAATPGPAPATVNAVLDALRSSELQFLRVEPDEVEVYSGREMARHVELKYLMNAAPELSASEFVRRYCSRSVFHGTDYLVRQADGRERKLADWLEEQIGVAKTGGDR